MYVIPDKARMNARVARLVDVLKAGGRARYALERQYGGREQFQVRVLDAQRQVVPGLGYRALHDAIALGLVERDWSVPQGSDWAQHYVIKQEVAA